MNGFTYSQLPPYDTWEAMSAGALEIWREYQAIVKPEEISRIALRYINALAIPLPVQNFDDYLTHAPQVPKELPQSLASFLNRVLIHDQENKDIAQVTQMLEGEASDGKAINILFDIDVFHPCQLKSATEEQIFSVLQRLREFKNKAFFGFLEEKILEPYA
ncbi:hypothetical protein D9X30_0415 [Cupriavidus sp. U2]|nr:hypothetical protein D9X30_0415 [Cupriavidus sp. U2]